MALKGKQFLDQVSKKSGGHLFMAALWEER